MARSPKRSQSQILADMQAQLQAQIQRVERAERIKAMREPYRSSFQFVSACVVKNDKALAEDAISAKCHKAVNSAYAAALLEIEQAAEYAKQAAKEAEQAAKAAKEAAKEVKADEAGDL